MNSLVSLLTLAPLVFSDHVKPIEAYLLSAPNVISYTASSAPGGVRTIKDVCQGGVVISDGCKSLEPAILLPPSVVPAEVVNVNKGVSR